MKDLSAADWNARYLNKDTPWDLSGPTPEFLRLLSRLPTKGRAIVPGGGRGHDALLLAQRGLEVDLVDFAQEALDLALENAFAQKLKINAYRMNFFSLPNLPFHRGQYSLFLEYTFYCAIDPALRPAYAKAAAALLKPGGIFLALFFPTETEKAGPPFAISRPEIEKLFSADFHLQFEDTQASVKPRAGREFIGIFQRK